MHLQHGVDSICATQFFVEREGLEVRGVHAVCLLRLDEPGKRSAYSRTERKKIIILDWSVKLTGSSSAAFALLKAMRSARLRTPLGLARRLSKYLFNWI